MSVEGLPGILTVEGIDDLTALALNRGLLHNEATRVDSLCQGSAKDSLEKENEEKNNENHSGLRKCDSCCSCCWFAVVWLWGASRAGSVENEVV
jgi:hypothetical protein